ncbi:MULTISPECIES: TraR/DksA C4-type zinc finger protein [unclassified Nocardioides]|uniref:TraR/DksA family transcriptional regulator n=1 Tax=unclassified Nocardioides TaxID=2615069 RepID=UPI00266570A7|nr:TraR/DksA C4-type zinc finger protein [Nocardioides sp. Arc9.136]WKN49330.1 TraR/DksA C4-type zinc finger protein [Nocardioides sp. Arc9.136]
MPDHQQPGGGLNPQPPPSAAGSESAPEAEARLRAEHALVARRLEALQGDYSGMVEASRDTNADDEHDPEGATIAFERSQLDTLVRQASGRLAEIEAALARLGEGAYGVCEGCGRPIPPERLEVRPDARRCVACG